FWGAYFESRVFLDFIEDKTLEVRKFESEKDLCEAIEKEDFDLLLLEPVRYDWELNVLNIEKIIESISKLQNIKYRLVIFDTTLISENLPLNKILEKSKNIPYIIFAQFNSLLKLNQEGLEFANAGLVSLYTNNLYFKDINSESIAIYLRKMRTILGTGLDLREILLLDNPFTFNRKKVQIYSEKVFLNNSLLAKSISQKGLFKEVVHPSIGNRASFIWAKSPFVILKLHEDNL
ncbi:TPA: hypothetical protein ACOTG1_003394, partial [Clostridium perfringens]